MSDFGVRYGCTSFDECHRFFLFFFFLVLPNGCFGLLVAEPAQDPGSPPSKLAPSP
jgi:hypothetical protein